MYMKTAAVTSGLMPLLVVPAGVCPFVVVSAPTWSAEKDLTATESIVLCGTPFSVRAALSDVRNVVDIVAPGSDIAAKLVPNVATCEGLTVSWNVMVHVSACSVALRSSSSRLSKFSCAKTVTADVGRLKERAMAVFTLVSRAVLLTPEIDKTI